VNPRTKTGREGRREGGREGVKWARCSENVSELKTIFFAKGGGPECPFPRYAYAIYSK